MNRRKFLRSAGATGLAVATLPTIIDSFTVKAFAGGDPRLQQLLESQDRVLVLIQMPGGNDGLNTIIPYTDPVYYNSRPTIGIPKSRALRLNDTLGWHPALAGMRNLFEEGSLAVVQGVTYPNPDRSHFRGSDIWLTATDADVFGSTGWVGRYLQTLAPNYPTVLPEHPLAVQIGTSTSLGLLGSSGPMGISFRDPDEFYRLVNAGGGIEEVPSGTQTDTPAGREAAFMRNIARSADVYATIVKQANDSAGSPSVTYPTTDIGAKLRVVSQLVTGGLTSRIFLISWTGNNFDTHADQTSSSDPTLGAHAALLGELSGAVSAFMEDMKNKGLAEKISGMTFSEFGRRVAENGSVGTDHGTAAPLFVFGKNVNGGLYGKNPNLTDLDDRGDLLMENDYRDIYASVLLQWFGASTTKAQDVLFTDHSANALPLFKTEAVSVKDYNSSAATIVSVGPNPATDHVVVRTRIDVNATASVTLSDLRGRELRSLALDSWSGVGTIDVQTLPSGTYLLTLKADRATTHTFVNISR